MNLALKRVAAASAFACIGLAVDSAKAETVYRCGNSYSQVACSNAKQLDVDDSRTEAQRADSMAVAKQERRRADDMEHERHRQEAISRLAVARETNTRPLSSAPTGMVTPAATKTHKGPQSRKAGRTVADDFVVVSPRSKKELLKTPASQGGQLAKAGR